MHSKKKKKIRITCALEIMDKSVVYAAIITEKFSMSIEEHLSS